MKRILFSVLTLSLALSLSACGQTPTTQRTKDIAVLYTGDVHVAFDGATGYEGLAAFKNELAADNTEVLLVDTGDAIQGAPIGKLSQGETPIEIMNALGYDAMALGNHEFDYGVDVLESLSKLAKFPFLSLNFTNISDGKSVYQPYTILERDNVKIAFVGVSTPKTITSSTPAFFQDEAGKFKYSFMQDDTGATLWAGVQASVDAARKEGADYVIALTHLGIEASTAPYLSTTLIESTKGIDAVLDGHSHSVVECQRITNLDGERILLSSTGSRLEKIGYLLIDKSGNISTGLMSDYTQKDDAATALIAEKTKEFEEFLQKPAGSIANDFVVKDPKTDVRIVRNAETNLGNLCADAIRHAAGADIAVVNGGGVRANLTAGEITYGDVLNVFPFGNNICMIEVSGQQMLDALEFSVSDVPNEFGGFLQVSGIAFEYNPNIPSPVKRDDDNMFSAIEGERRVRNVTVLGKAVLPDAKYTLAGVEYGLLQNGDGYTMFANSKIINTEIAVDYDVLVDYLKTEYKNTADTYQNPYGDGRIVALQ